MTFFPEPIKPSEGRKDDEIIVNPIEADKKGQDNNPDETLPSGKKGSFYGSMMVLFKKLATLVSGKRGEGFSEDAFVSDIISLKNALDQLKELDQSENSHFCQNLSEIWHSLLQHMQLAKRAKMKTGADLAKLKIVLSDIDHYPPNEEHKLGYYLSQYAGEDWLPVPFMEILKKLHSDYKVNQNTSILERWTDLLRQSAEGKSD